MTQSFMQQPAYQDTDYIEEYKDDASYQRATGYQAQYQNDDVAQYRNQQTYQRYPSNNYNIQSNSRAPQQMSLSRTQITISVSRSPNCFLSTHILTYFSIGLHLQQQNASTSRRMQPMPDRPSDQNYQQHNVPQSASYNSQTQFSQDQPDYRRGENPRNSHGTRLRPVSELRKSTVIS